MKVYFYSGGKLICLDNKETNDSSYSQPEQLSKSQKINTATSTRAAQINMLTNRAKQVLGDKQFEQVSF